jgi:hypothetical protein
VRSPSHRQGPIARERWAHCSDDLDTAWIPMRVRSPSHHLNPIAPEVTEPATAWVPSHVRMSRSPPDLPPDPPYLTSKPQPSPISTRCEVQERGGPAAALISGLFGLFRRPPPVAVWQRGRKLGWQQLGLGAPQVTQSRQREAWMRVPNRTLASSTSLTASSLEASSSQSSSCTCSSSAFSWST